MSKNRSGVTGDVICHILGHTSPDNQMIISASTGILESVRFYGQPSQLLRYEWDFSVY